MMKHLLLAMSLFAWSTIGTVTAQIADEAKSTRGGSLPGFDAPGGSWTKVDYDKYAKAMAKIGSLEYPVWESGNGVLLNGYIQTDVLDYCPDEDIRLELRMQNCIMLFMSIKDTLKFYAYGGTPLRSLIDEVHILSGFTLQAAYALGAPVKEFVATLDPTDRDYGIRMQGLARMKQGHAGMLIGALTILSNPGEASPKARLQLALDVSDTFTFLRSGASEKDKSEIDTLLVKLLEVEQDDRVVMALELIPVGSD